MENRIIPPERLSDLRQRAEKIAQDKESFNPRAPSAPPPQPSPKAPEEAQRLLHELQVHQIELELQNEELRRAEAAAAASRARFFDLYDLAPVSYLTVCAKGVIREANLTVATLLGTTRGSLIRQHLSRFILLDDLSLFYQHYKKFFASGEPDSFDLQMVKADGTTFWAHHVVTPEPVSRKSSAGPHEGEPVCRIAISDLSERKQAEHSLQTAYAELEQRVAARTEELHQANCALRAEIDERRKAEEALRESERRCREVVDFAVDGILLGSPEGLITEANKRMCTLFELPREELLGKDIRTLPFKEESLEKYPFRFDLLQQGETLLRERVLIRPDGSEVIVEMRSKMMPDGTYQSIFRDITERKQAEAEREKLEAQNRQLQKSESLGRMAGAIAHHFNNQLGAVIGNLELAMTDRDDLDTNLQGAMASANKAAEVSSLMLTYLGQSVESKEILDLSEICRQSIPVLKALMPKSVILETDFLATGPYVTGNANQIHQVLTNLLTNAWEACHGTQGVIRITVNVAAPKEISSTNRFPLDSQAPVDPYVLLEMKDTGNGIASEDMPNLFDPFFTRKFPGRGMGLAIVLGIVRAHHGFITVESSPGSGSTFRLNFPHHFLMPRKTLASY